MAQCKKLTFEQKFIGGEPGKAVMVPSGIEGPCTIEQPAECKVESIVLNGPREEWHTTLEVIGTEVWQVSDEKDVLPLKYVWNAGNPPGCPTGKESDANLEYRAKLSEMVFTGPAVGAEV
ncbi:MAG: hypothetical protein ACYCU0_06265 [Solirubrobacteraceae bacterium]